MKKIYEIKIIVNSEINDFEIENLFNDVQFIEDVEYTTITKGE